MNESSFNKLCVAGIFIGLISIYTVSNIYEYPNVNIGEIKENMVGSVVNVTGEITKINSNKNGDLFIEIKDDTGKVKVVLWHYIIENLAKHEIDINNIKKGCYMNVVGEVNMYRGQLEIIPIKSNVKIINCFT